MEPKPKEASSGKERTGRSLPCPASPRRATSKKKSPGSSPSPSTKPLPNYLKPTISSSHGESCRTPLKKPDAAPNSNPYLNRRRSFDGKPPKPSPTSSPSNNSRTFRSLSLTSRRSPAKKNLTKNTVEKKESEGTTGSISDPEDAFSSIGTEPDDGDLVLLDSKETILDISMENHENVDLPVADWEMEEAATHEIGEIEADGGNGGEVEGVVEEDEVVIHEVGDGIEGDGDHGVDRHESDGKKDGVGYNDVIEETASKLLEERKNKVKALVGAFETVISLQDQEQA